MRNLVHMAFGVFVGLVAVGIVRVFDMPAVLMFGVGMVYGSLAQLLAQRLFTDRHADRAEQPSPIPDVPAPREAVASVPAALTDSAAR